MPTTPNFAIPYPCMGATFDCNAMGALALGTEAAIATVNAEATAVTHTPYAIQLTSTVVPVGVATTLAFAASAFNFSGGVTVGAASFTILTPGLYLATVQSTSVDSNTTLTSGRLSVLKNAVLQYAIKRKPLVAFPTFSNTDMTGPVDCVAGDVITYQLLWTGTGALTANYAASVYLQMLSTP